MDVKDISAPTIALGELFSSFDSLKDAIDIYQRENNVQLVVKDSKQLSSIGKKMPKIHELANKDILYYRLSYACEYHGEFKPTGRVKSKYISKRQGCPMRILVRMTEDMQHLVVCELYQQHNHTLDRRQLTRTPRQHLSGGIYQLSLTNPSQYLIKKLENGQDGQIIETETASGSQDFGEEPSSIDRNSSKSTTPIARIIGNGTKRIITAADVDDVSIGDLKKQKLTLENRKLELEARKLELENMKLELELKAMERKQEESDGNTIIVSHLDDTKGLTETTMNGFSTSTAEVIRSLTGRGQPVQIITQS